MNVSRLSYGLHLTGSRFIEVMQLHHGLGFEGAPDQHIYCKRFSSKYCKYNCSIHLLVVKCSCVLSRENTVANVNVIGYFVLGFIDGSRRGFARVNGRSRKFSEEFVVITVNMYNLQRNLLYES
jgi:hypothetical protein